MGTFTHLTIHQKLIGVIAILMMLIVGVLTAYFPSRQIAALTQGLANRAETYGALLSHQLAPAVAFGDRATAREVLTSLAADPDVAGGVLCLANGRALHAVGKITTACPTAEQATSGVTATPELVVVVTKVVSPEGPRGTLVIELSTSRLREGQRSVTMTAVFVGCLALAAGVLAAWLIARSIARRLRRIADVASAVTAGALDQQPIADQSLDEIGTLARGFNAMLSQLRDLIANVQQMAKREQEILAQANRTLELRVAERTGELSTANDQLKREMEERSKIEVELRHAQKLESVGRLAAGVAHEINTPVQFVSDSLHFVRDAMKDLTGVIETLQVVNSAVLEGAPSQGAAEKAAEMIRSADLPYLFENVPPALDRAMEGLDRVAVIVRSMKEFAHPDQKEMTEVDLNRAIESTLTIARSEYKFVADLETDFGDVPRAFCHAGDVNQAVLNIVVNASHAIADVVNGTGTKGRLMVRTRHADGHVAISISDTGGGIPEGVRDRIFDPFFTTKEVGRGTGQGLAISRAVIVDKHHGTLTFETVMGQGTTFVIRLPIERHQVAEAAAP